MGTDRYMEERDACPSQLAAANAKIAELERELAERSGMQFQAEQRLRGGRTTSYSSYAQPWPLTGSGCVER